MAPVQSPLIQTALFPNNDHDLAFNSGVYAQKSANSSTGFNTEWKVNNDLKVDLDVHHSTSKTDPTALMALGADRPGDVHNGHHHRLLRQEAADP